MTFAAHKPTEEPPRAPSQDEWDAMTPAQRKAVVDSLPAYIPWEECGAPEGDQHIDTKIETRDTLRRYFNSTGRSVYVGSEIAVYYPAEVRFAPDVFAVVGAEPHPRQSWIVSAEGRGLDWVLEVLVAGERRRDLSAKVRRYASVGIPEYFVVDHGRSRLVGYRLAAKGVRTYEPIEPQHAWFPSAALGLELALIGKRLRFRHGNAELLATDDLIERLELLAAERAAAAEAELLMREEETRLREEETRLREEEMRLREEAERKVAALEEELARLRGERR